MTRPRLCVARPGCQGRAVAKVAGPVGTFGQVSACWRCWERATGQTWTGERPASTVALVSRRTEPRKVSEVDRRPRLDQARSPVTRMLALAERGPLPGQGVLASLLGCRDANEAGRMRRKAREHGWLDEGWRLTARGAEVLRVRRAVLAAAGEEVTCVE